MKTSNLLVKTASCLALFLMALALNSCYEEVNDWPVDSSYEKLFRPLKFEQKALTSNSIEISYSKIVGAVAYEFEVSNDSLYFNNIILSTQVLADTLTPSANSSNASRVEYLIAFAELDASTLHSVRMRGVSSNGLYSEYVQLMFQTPDENIFTGEQDISNDEITVRWVQTDKVTHLSVVEDATGEYILEQYALTPDEIASAEISVDGLKAGTYYTFTIYNNEKARGSVSVKTSGTAGSMSYDVFPGDDMAAILSDLLLEGISNVTLVFQNEQVYDMGALKIPAGMISVTFSASTGIRPVINGTVGWNSNMDALYFENVEFVGADNTAYFINTNLSVGSISFENCKLNTYRCIVRVQNSAIEVERISINRCWLNDISGGYGVFNVGGNSAKVGDIELTESLLTEISTQVGDIRTPAQSITVRNCTFYNMEQRYSQIFRFNADDNLPGTLTFEKCIFSGKNQDQTSKSVDRSSAVFSFAGSYRTSEFKEGSPKFNDITEYTGTASDLFTDPDKGDFSIKPGAGFAGEGSAGYPYW